MIAPLTRLPRFQTSLVLPKQFLCSVLGLRPSMRAATAGRCRAMLSRFSDRWPRSSRHPIRAQARLPHRRDRTRRRQGGAIQQARRRRIHHRGCGGGTQSPRRRAGRAGGPHQRRGDDVRDRWARGARPVHRGGRRCQADLGLAAATDWCKPQHCGHAAGASIDSQDTLAFSTLSGVRPMIETMQLSHAAEAYDRMMRGDARFRMVLTMA
jgi:hypothetical protein